MFALCFEISQVSTPYVQTIMYGTIVMGFNFILKMLYHNKFQKMIAEVVFVAYIFARLAYKHGVEDHSLSYLVTLFYMLAHYMTFDFDDDINLLLLKRCQ